MSDDPVTACEVCGKPVERVFHPIAVHFKGSGFYTTDYAKKGAEKGSSDGDGKKESSSDKKSDSGSSTKSDAGSKPEKKSESKSKD